MLGRALLCTDPYCRVSVAEDFKAGRGMAAFAFDS